MSNVIVELDIFSGRPNPRWELTTEEAIELARRVAGLPPAGPPSASAPLGYRGFVIVNDDRMAGLPARLHVRGGLVAVPAGSRVDYYHDLRDVERWLLDQARARGYGNLLDAVTKGR